MSLSITDAVECPGCGHVRAATFWTSVNADLNPDLKQSLLDGTFFRHDCPRCGREIVIEHELLYHDMRRHAMVYYAKPGERPPDLAGVRLLLSQSPDVNYKLRLVPTLPDLFEKIAILDNGFDDRLVEAFKYALAEKLAARDMQAAEIRFLRRSPDSNSRAIFRVFEQDGAQQDIVVPFRKAYDDLRDALRPALKADAAELEWRVVDSRYFPMLLARNALA